MKCGKWIVGTAALALGLSAGVFAQDHPRYDGRDGDAARYTQRDPDLNLRTADIAEGAYNPSPSGAVSPILT